MVDYVNGSELPTALKMEAKRRYVHRFTKEHKPQWACQPRPDGSAYMPQFADDADWLANTTFPVTAKCTLAKRPSDCRSSPTWPDGMNMK